MLRSNDPLPQNVIRFSEAFEHFYQTTEPKWQELEAGVNDAIATCQGGGLDKWYANQAARESARISAWRQLRSMLETGKLVACIRDPDTDKILELDRKGWAGSQGLGPRCSFDDFICPNDPIQPGPLAAIGGKLRPVFFMKDAFARALKSGLPASGKRQGRMPKYDRQFIREKVFELMDHHGDFLESDPEWRCQADLERAVIASFENKGLKPAESTVRKLVTEALKERYADRSGR
jgi:hypothetical protein